VLATTLLGTYALLFESENMLNLLKKNTQLWITMMGVYPLVSFFTGSNLPHIYFQALLPTI